MTGKRLSVPEPGVRAIAHELAYKIAVKQFTGIKDYEKQCHKSGARYASSEKAILIEYLNRSYRISLPDGEITLDKNTEDVPKRDKILILHYFLRAAGTPLTGNFITYNELKEGLNYYPTFFKRAIDPIINNFKDEPQKLLETAAALGGIKSNYGDTAVKINAFPYVPITFVLWHGDKEFPPDGNIMFDSTIQDYLPTEDVTVLCEVIAWKLVRLLKTGGGNPG